jgi:hypothetical protein
MQEAARLSWLIHDNGYDDNIGLKHMNMKNRSDITFPRIWQAPMCHELQTGKYSRVDVS